MNINIRLFQVKIMGLCSDLIRAQDESGIIERMASDYGTPLCYCYSYSDEKEQAFTGPITIKKVDDEYSYDEPEDKTTPIKQPMPDYLNLYNGGVANGSRSKLH